jgi:Subtilase family
MNAVRFPQARPLRRLPLAVAIFACALAPASAAAVSAPPGGASLSPRLAELAKPALVGASPAAQAAALERASSGPGGLLIAGNRALAYVRFESGAVAGVAALRSAGASVVNASRRYQTVTVAARPADLAAVAALPRVAAVSEVLAPIISASCGGSVVSEGDAQLNANSARASFGVDGSGVTVGLLSDSFNRNAGAPRHAAEDIASGDLPGPGSPCGSTPVSALDDSAGGEDEGRAMAQIVHDLAPGAAIDFATAVAGELAFAANIRALAGAGAKVIADDVAYPEEPLFQDGPVAVAASEATAAGVSIFSAAGNSNITSGGHQVASYEASSFRDSGSCPLGVPVLAPEAHCMDFDPGVGTENGFEMTVKPHEKVLLDLQWAEPWNGVGDDLDAYLLNGSGAVLLEKKDGNNVATQKPFELLEWVNNSASTVTVNLAINRFAGTNSPRLKFIQLGNGAEGVFPTAAQYNISSAGDVFGPAILGHSGSESVIAAAAVPFDDKSVPEPYSAPGPVTHFFGPVTGASAAAPIAERIIPKPDLAATDGGANTFFGELVAGTWRFFGTSAAAPHAAAVAALLRQANPGASQAQVRSTLRETAVPVGSAGADVVGAGLVNAFTAVERIALPPTVTITQPPPTLSRNRQPQIQFTANRPVAFRCAVDGGEAQPCSSPFTVPTPLADGTHAVAVSAVDLAGREGSATASFKIDTKAPQTTIAKHPPKLLRTHHRKARAIFRFRSNESDVTFVCKIDRELPRFCKPRIVRRLEAGRHTLQVRAEDTAGNVDRSAAVFRFRVKRVG